ncbi:MAG: L-2-amino-thiazoline-4-carboxylic acid hydrolase, partial [Kofleriaceae bacterium]
WGRFASRLARLKPGKKSALGFATASKGKTVSLSFPFNAPGYQIKEVLVQRGTGFNVVHCPVATYFREHDAIDLCFAAWCNLDYALGEITHQKLVRTQTLVQGARHCDLRIFPVEAVRVTPSGAGNQ